MQHRGGVRNSFGEGAGLSTRRARRELLHFDICMQDRSTNQITPKWCFNFQPIKTLQNFALGIRIW